jgi:hypothetical protein
MKVIALSDSDSAWANFKPTFSVKSFNLVDENIHALQTGVRLNKSRDFVSHLQSKPTPIIWLVNSFCLNTWVQQPYKGVTSLKEAKILIQNKANQIFGEAPDKTDWSIAADWQSNVAFTCHALPENISQALNNDLIYSPLTLALEFLKTQKITASLNKITWYVFTPPGEIHVFSKLQNQLVSIVSRRVDWRKSPVELVDQVLALWHQEQAQANNWVENKLHWLCAAPFLNSHSIQLKYPEIEWLATSSNSKPIEKTELKKTQSEQLLADCLTQLIVGKHE